MGEWFKRLFGWLTRRQPRGQRTAYCSFCRRSHLDVGPLAEGPDLVFICRHCIESCGRLVPDARRYPDPSTSTEGSSV